LSRRAKMTDADDERRTEGGLSANHLESDGED
jgi:hypothetical protein